MSTKINTAWGTALPPAPRHAVTVHIPSWDTSVQFGSDPSALLAKLHSSYPRIKPHRDVTALSAAVLQRGNFQGQLCHLFSSLQSAKECVEFAVAARRETGPKKPVPRSQLNVRAFKALDRFIAVIFPADAMPTMFGFWIAPGVGISSRFAEAQLQNIDQLNDISLDDMATLSASFSGPAHDALSQRIIELLQRAPRDSVDRHWPTAKDVYFFPSGMAGIYNPHTWLTNAIGSTTVLFGMAFMNSVQLFQEFGNGVEFFGHGTGEDIKKLEEFLESERAAGRKVQAIWAELPANPLLVTPDLKTLRRLADAHNVVLGIDDTLGSFSNLDVLDMVDLLVSSLTKTFNGYADVLAGSVVLNPASRRYSLLKGLFDENYVPGLYNRDADAMLKNSTDYLERTTRHQTNASAVVAYLQSCAADPASAVAHVNYPSVNSSGVHYREFMRTRTDDFDPGFGCLLSVELSDKVTAKAFYDNLNVHNGPHLGAPLTLAIPYTVMVYTKQLEWANQYGLREPLIRVSIGLEDTDQLLEDFKLAVDAANEAKRSKSMT